MVKIKTRDEFLRMAASYLPRRCNAVELGVLNGDFSEMILSILNPNKLLLVDPFEIGTETYNEEMNRLPVAYSTERDLYEVVKRFESDRRVSIYRKYSRQAVDEMEDKSFDLIYHDASHLAEDVYFDLIAWLVKLTDGGLICGHDYIDHKSFGVIAAVDDFCKQYDFEMIIFNEDGGDYALRRK